MQSVEGNPIILYPPIDLDTSAVDDEPERGSEMCNQLRIERIWDSEPGSDLIDFMQFRPHTCAYLDTLHC
jgi:hypothetical protein